VLGDIRDALTDVLRGTVVAEQAKNFVKVPQNELQAHPEKFQSIHLGNNASYAEPRASFPPLRTPADFKGCRAQAQH
jgi:hypothetical protein